MNNEIHTTGEFILSRKETYGKNKQIKPVPVFTSRMEKREYYKNVHLFDIRNVLDVGGLLKDISENLHTYVKQVQQWIQKNPIKRLIVTGIFTVVLGLYTINANAAYIQEYTYQVKNNEKIEEIAAKHGVTVQGILDANGLTSITGKKILLPKVEDRTVTATTLNVRSQPTTEGSIIGKYKKGDIVKVSFVENGWAGILIKGRVCFVSADYLTQTEVDSTTVETEAKIMYVTASTLRVREAASTGSDVLGSLKLNDPVTVISSVNGWAKINFQGKAAFVSGKYLKSKETSPSAEYVIKKGDTFTKLAKDLGITLTAIQKLNPTVKPTKLKIGQQIRIPVTTASIPNRIKVTGQIGAIDSEGTFLFITGDGHTNTAKATGKMINELFNHQGEIVTLTLEGKRGQKLTLISFQ
ncbi:SH3 domain-containing protein [Neobacillus cucumis]|uniref:SH3 domain-containing protein n=1 Tax=Neobacillus cucumis TaxID=1740721 RepID=UPI00203E8895|nr:SH3 domain-containing protein [Neobacillus cucumis]MCM3729605.1 SH3 domain-containing protein [Neobacillus cucumis]